MLDRKNNIETVRAKWVVLQEHMTERARRRWAGAEARAIGWGGVSQVAQATGLSRMTVAAGVAEVRDATGIPEGRQRRVGAGRPPLSRTDPTLVPDLERLVDPVTRGDPMNPLRWTCKSKEELAGALRAMGHGASPNTVGRLLKGLGFSL